jgi:DNA-binding GntR family transcriptional regulator
MTAATGSALRAEEQAEVRRQLEEDIIFGRLYPGMRLIEDNLMARYGTSRHYVRQALVDLERSGIVLRERNIGATVRSYSPDEVRHIYEVREMLSRQAALKIALPAPIELVERLREIQAEYRRCAAAGNLRGVHETNDLFHLTLFSGCGNPYLVQTLQEFMVLTLPMRAKNLADTVGLEKSIRQHDTMIALLQSTDSWALSQLCVDHMQHAKMEYLQKADDPGPNSVSKITAVRRSERR